MVKRSIFVFVAAFLMLSGGMGFLISSDAAEADVFSDVQYGETEFSFGVDQPLLNIRDSRPKGSDYMTVVVGDTLNISCGPHDVWHGGWFNTKYERYVEITGVAAVNYVNHQWQAYPYPPEIDRSSAGINDTVPFINGSHLQISWVLKYKDHGVIYQETIEDSGTFRINVLNPVHAVLEYESGEIEHWYGRDSVTLPDGPAVPGHAFAGWLDTRAQPVGGIRDSGYVLTFRSLTGINYLAVYDASYYTITFDSAGGNEISPRQVLYDHSYGELPVPVRPGYTFTGWYDGATKVTSATVPTDDVTLRAGWEPNTIQYTAPSGQTLSIGAYWSHTLSTTPGVSITISGTGTSWISSSGGVISGTPATAGVYQVTVILTAPDHLTATKTFDLSVEADPLITAAPKAGASATVIR